MTGIERLRQMAEDFKSVKTSNHCTFIVNTWRGRYIDDAIADIADQIEREQDKVASTDWQTVRDVASDMAGRTFMSITIDSLLEEWSRKLTDASDGHERAADVSMSAYDLLPQEEREAIAWVREHGGIAYVKDAWNVRSNLDRQLEKAQAKVERQQRHIEFVQRLCRERREHICELNKLKRAYVDALNGVCKRLGLTDGTGLPDIPEVIWTELDRRLMPEGMEWPKVNGEPVAIGERMRSCGIEDCKVVGIDPDNSMLILASDEIEKGKATYFPDFAVYCRRPAPKVLDADGAEIELGDDLYSVEGSLKFHVSHVDRINGKIATDAMFSLDKWADPAMYTHRAPVLAADGRPLREGEHVYHVETGAELVVKELPKPGAYQAVVVFAPPASHLTSFDPDRLTHERPAPKDSWERLEEDVAGASCPDVYCANHRIDASDTSYEWAMARDIVRRAKALAGGA